jgi:tetratricopeptide (TPR) repeat protein
MGAQAARAVNDCKPLPLSIMFALINSPREPSPATESIQRVSVWRQMVDDYRPLAHSLEWQLSTLHWIEAGVLPFIDSSVPFLINNNGRLSSNAAALLFANCVEAPPGEGDIAVLEFGAGTGLFARYLLDEFRLLCERESRDFYSRLCYYVTDRSPRTVQQWEERGVFQGHTGRVIARASDANSVETAAGQPVRAVFCNYLLDSLPSAIVRKTERGWEQVFVRAWLPDDALLLRQYTRLNFDEIRAMAASADLDHKLQLLPLLPLLEFQADFFPAGQDRPRGLEQFTSAAAGGAFGYNFGAIECLESALEVLEPTGFILVNDYTSTVSASQRFGPTTAMGLNFPLLEEHFKASGIETLKPEGDDGRSIHARLLLRSGLPGTRRTFETQFAASALQHAEAPVERARQEAGAGLFREALADYRTAIERNPRDWQLIGEAAAFVSAQLGEHAAGAELARAAIDLNPWYSASLWNVLGECLSRMERHEEAHECYLQACRIHPGDVTTNLNLARSWLKQGDPRQSLEAVARGLANDSEAMFRHTLLERQQEAIAALSIRWNRERGASARRSSLGPR